MTKREALIRLVEGIEASQTTGRKNFPTSVVARALELYKLIVEQTPKEGAGTHD